MRFKHQEVFLQFSFAYIFFKPHNSRPDTHSHSQTYIPAFAWKSLYILSSETFLLLHQPHIFIYSSTIFSHSEMKQVVTVGIILFEKTVYT